MKYLIFLLVASLPFLSKAQTNLSNNLQPNTPKALDNRTGVFSGGLWKPYASTSAANTAINPFYRHLGMTVLIGSDSTSFQEYWYSGGISDNKLVLKSSAASSGLPDTTGYNNTFLTYSNYTVRWDSAVVYAQAFAFPLTDITADVNNPRIAVDATVGNRSVTLPTPSSAIGVDFIIKKIDAGANTVTVIGTIDGATNKVLSTQWKYLTITSNGTNYYIIANN